MGREIRRVPPNWQHPEHEVPDHRLGGFVKRPKPLHDESYGTVIAEWIENHLLWETGKHPDQQGEDRSQYRYYAQWGGDAPEVGTYRPDWKEGEATWWQVYETVSEGTPVTPAFATAEELIDYLVANGDYWDQQRREEGRTGGMQCSPWPRKAAEKFVRGSGWLPSMIATESKVMTGHEIASELK